jgi:hypothetical protein
MRFRYSITGLLAFMFVTAIAIQTAMWVHYSWIVPFRSIAWKTFTRDAVSHCRSRGDIVLLFFVGDLAGDAERVKMETAETRRLIYDHAVQPLLGNVDKDPEARRFLKANFLHRDYDIDMNLPITVVYPADQEPPTLYGGFVESFYLRLLFEHADGAKVATNRQHPDAPRAEAYPTIPAHIP